MKKMANYLVANSGLVFLALFGLAILVFAVTKMRAPIPVIPTTKSVDFTNDSVVSTPVLGNNPYANVFHDAAVAAIKDKTNPWVYLRENWEKAKEFKGVEFALLDFITNEAHQKIPDSSKVTLSVRDYSDPNSVVMEYRDPATDSVLVATGHDPEPALYATFFYKKDTVTFKLICANGLVRELGGKVISFDQDYLIKVGESFISITGATPHEASKFAQENNLPVRFVIEGRIGSKTPNTSRVKVFEDFRHFRNGIFDVVLQPGDILRRQDKKWLYVRQAK